MSQVPFALQFVVLAVSGWLTRRQQFAIEYLLEENRVLREQHTPQTFHEVPG